VDAKVVAVELGDVENVIDITRQAVGRDRQPCQQLRLVTLESAGQLLGEDVEITADDGDRAAEFVGGEGDEVEVFFLGEVLGRAVDEDDDGFAGCVFLVGGDDVKEASFFEGTVGSGNVAPGTLGGDLAGVGVAEPGVERLLVEKIQRQIRLAVGVSGNWCSLVGGDDAFGGIEDDDAAAGVIERLGQQRVGAWRSAFGFGSGVVVRSPRLWIKAVKILSSGRPAMMVNMVEKRLPTMKIVPVINQNAG